MKAAANGVLNVSTLDGWWCEGYTPEGGWVIGAGESYENQEYQDMVEAQALYNILEHEVVPLFFSRSADNLPRRWLPMMKACIKSVTPRFNTHRMLAEYAQQFYAPAASRYRRLTQDTLAVARDFARWKAEMRGAWREIVVQEVTMDANSAGAPEQLNAAQPQLKVRKTGPRPARQRFGRALSRAHRFLGQHSRRSGRAHGARNSERRKRRALVLRADEVPNHRTAWRRRSGAAAPSGSSESPLGEELSRSLGAFPGRTPTGSRGCSTARMPPGSKGPFPKRP